MSLVFLVLPSLRFILCIYKIMKLMSRQVIYRIKLPGPAILGEGKPENQNHAIIFTRGEGLQTIDMNQVLEWFVTNMINLLISLIPSCALSSNSSTHYMCARYRIITWRNPSNWGTCWKNFLKSMMVCGTPQYLDFGSIFSQEGWWFLVVEIWNSVILSVANLHL